MKASTPKSLPWGRRAVVEDPDGHCVELTEKDVIYFLRGFGYGSLKQGNTSDVETAIKGRRGESVACFYPYRLCRGETLLSDSNRKIRMRWILGVSVLVVGYIVANRTKGPQHVSANQDLAVAVSVRNVIGIHTALQQGADPNLEDINDWLPYVRYVKRSPPEPASLLLYSISNAPLPATDSDTTIARLLLEAGEDPNRAWKDGYTPLMAAAVRGDVNHTRLLLANGANVHAKDMDGKTALDWAQMPLPAGNSQRAVNLQNKQNVAELLKQAGARE